jgi:glycosyltransferase involved in cell wall biosynthesis
MLAAHDNFKYHFLPIPRRAYMGLFRMWQSPVDRFLPAPADAIWYPDFVAAPWIKSGKKVLTIHDLTYLHDAETVERKNLKYLTKFVPQSITRVDAITTVSHAVAREIMATYHPSAPVKIVYPPAPTQTPGAPAKKPYILFVGTLQPRKNLKGLLKAYSLLSNKLREQYKLVIAGRKGWRDTEMSELLKSVTHTWADGPTDAELHDLYLHANLLVLPSIREGFGIPPVEALACHVPVLTSQDPALVEATGKAALHVPADPAALAKAIEQLLTDKTLRDSLAAHRDEELAKLDGALAARTLIDLLTH